MRITWHRISLISLLTIFLSLVLSFWFIERYSVLRLFRQVQITHHQSGLILTETNSHNCLANIQQQEYIAAKNSCQQVVENDADNLDAYLNLGLAYYHLGDYPQAIAQYQLLIEQNPGDYRAFYNWGLVNSAKGEYQQAISRYQIALNLTEKKNETQRALILNDLGAVEIMLEQYDTAIANLDRAVELDPSNTASYFNRGCAHHHGGNYQAGINDFSQVITLDANYTEAYISRAILNHLVRYEKAAYRDLDTALQQYETKGDRAAYQKIMGLKNSIIASNVRQTA